MLCGSRLGAGKGISPLLTGDIVSSPSKNYDICTDCDLDKYNHRVSASEPHEIRDGQVDLGGLEARALGRGLRDVDDLAHALDRLPTDRAGPSLRRVPGERLGHRARGADLPRAGLADAAVHARQEDHIAAGVHANGARGQ